MLINCPNCGTGYILKPAQLGEGRNVSCSNCSHVWFQDPSTAKPDPVNMPARAPAAAQPASPMPPAAPPPGYGAYPPAYGYGAPPPGYPPAPGYPPPYPPAYPPQPGYSQPAGAPPAPGMVPAPVPDAEAPAPTGGGLAGILDAPIPEPVEPENENPVMDDEPEAMEDFDPPETLPTDIDDMFEDEDDPEPFESLVSSNDAMDGIDFNEDEEPDPIPEVFSGDEQEEFEDEDASKPWAKIIAFATLGTVVIVLTVLVFARGLIVDMVPALEDVYESVGLPATQLGEGLQLRSLRTDQDTEAGLEVLVIRGEVVSVEDEKTRPVPHLRGILRDQEGEILQNIDAVPLKSELGPGEAISFQIRIVEPSPLRRRVEVIMVDPAESEAGQ